MPVIPNGAKRSEESPANNFVIGNATKQNEESPVNNLVIGSATKWSERSPANNLVLVGFNYTNQTVPNDGTDSSFHCVPFGMTPPFVEEGVSKVILTFDTPSHTGNIRHPERNEGTPP